MDLALFKKLKNPKLFYLTFKIILIKEVLFLIRYPMVFFASFIFPIVEIFIVGHIVANNVQQIETVCYDVANTQESRNLIDEFINTNSFKIVKYVASDKELYDTIIAGNAKVGIKIPVNYSKNLLNQQTASVLVIIDGSNAAITAEAINTANIMSLQNSIKELTLNANPPQSMPVEIKASVLFNPDGKPVNYLLIGALVFELTTITMMFTALSIVNEKEQGTLEQLSLTPVQPIGFLLGKIFPYTLLALLQQFLLIMELKIVFSVPIKGDFALLMAIFIPYIILTSCIGIVIAFLVNSQIEVIQLSALVRIIPAIYLSGYVFPIEGMPDAVQPFIRFIPETQLLEVMRAIILRGASFSDLLLPISSLTIIAGLTLIVVVTYYGRTVKWN